MIEIKDQRLIDLLIHKCFSDTENDISRKSQEAVAAIGPDAVVPLIESLPGAHEAVTMQHRVSGRVLNVLRDGRAVESLIQMLSSSDAAMREISAEALGRIGDTTAIAHLLKLLSDSDQDAENAAALSLSLARLGDDSGRVNLIKLQEDSSKFEFQRDRAAQAIRFLNFLEKNNLIIRDVPDWHFSIACPKTWPIVRKNKKVGTWNVAFQANGPKRGDLRTGMMVNVRPGGTLMPDGFETFQWGADGQLMRHPKTPDDFLKESLDHLNQTFKKVKILSGRPISCRGWPGTNIIHCHQASKN